MVDFSEKLKQNKAAMRLIEVLDLEYTPTAREKRLETFILSINEALRGSQSPEVKNMAVKSLRLISREIASDQKERAQNNIED